MLKVYKMTVNIYQLNNKQFKLVYPYLSGFAFHQQKGNIHRLKISANSKEANELLTKIGAIKE